MLAHQDKITTTQSWEARHKHVSRADGSRALPWQAPLPTAATFAATTADRGFFHSQPKISVKANVSEPHICICSMQFTRTRPADFKSQPAFVVSLCGPGVQVPKPHPKAHQREERGARRGEGRGVVADTALEHPHSDTRGLHLARCSPATELRQPAWESVWHRTCSFRCLRGWSPAGVFTGSQAPCANQIIITISTKGKDRTHGRLLSVTDREGAATLVLLSYKQDYISN